MTTTVRLFFIMGALPLIVIYARENNLEHGGEIVEEAFETKGMHLHTSNTRSALNNEFKKAEEVMKETILDSHFTAGWPTTSKKKAITKAKHSVAESTPKPRAIQAMATAKTTKTKITKAKAETAKLKSTTEKTRAASLGSNAASHSPSYEIDPVMGTLTPKIKTKTMQVVFRKTRTKIEQDEHKTAHRATQEAALHHHSAQKEMAPMQPAGKPREVDSINRKSKVDMIATKAIKASNVTHSTAAKSAKCAQAGMIAAALLLIWQC